jgi:hypothetical protein
MKKFYTFVIASFCAVAAFAQTPNYQVEKVANAPVIDGTIDAMWEKIDPIEMNNLSDDGSSLDFVSFKLAWNDTALFVMAEVYDNEDIQSPMDRGLFSGSNWKTDRAEFYISGNPISVAKQWGAGLCATNGNFVPSGEHYSGTWQFANRVPAGADTALFSSELITHISATHKDGEAYICEFSLNWDFLVDSVGGRSIMPKNGEMFLFDASFCDVDAADPDGTRHFVRWINPSPWDRMNVAETGIMKLVDNLGTTSVKELAGATINVYPNPVDDLLKISNIEFDEVRIYNVMGQEVLQKFGQNNINVSELNYGLYAVSVWNKGQFVGNSRFVKK